MDAKSQLWNKLYDNVSMKEVTICGKCKFSTYFMGEMTDICQCPDAPYHDFVWGKKFCRSLNDGKCQYYAKREA